MGFVLDVSRLDLACLDGSDAGIIEYEQIQKGNPKHTEDALIALTAHREATVLVTEDNNLTKKIKATKTSLTLWKFEEFKNLINSMQR
jgi:predicted nucleic acid-binding protein